MKYISIPEDEFKKIEEDASKYNLNVQKHHYSVSLEIKYEPENGQYVLHKSIYGDESCSQLEFSLRHNTWSIFSGIANDLNYRKANIDKNNLLIQQELAEIKKKWWYKLFN